MMNQSDCSSHDKDNGSLTVTHMLLDTHLFSDCDFPAWTKRTKKYIFYVTNLWIIIYIYFFF